MRARTDAFRLIRSSRSNDLGGVVLGMI